MDSVEGVGEEVLGKVGEGRVSKDLCEQDDRTRGRGRYDISGVSGVGSKVISDMGDGVGGSDNGGGTGGEPGGAKAAVSSRVGVPLDAIVVIGAIAEVPGGPLMCLGVAHNVGSRGRIGSEASEAGKGGEWGGWRAGSVATAGPGGVAPTLSGKGGGGGSRGSGGSASRGHHGNDVLFGGSGFPSDGKVFIIGKFDGL